MRTCLLVLYAGLFFTSCSKPYEVFDIIVPEINTEYDSLFFQELITGKVLGKVPLNSSQKKFSFLIEGQLLASIQVKGSDKSYLTILGPGVSKSLIPSGDFFVTKESPADSMANVIWHSTNEMFSRYAGLIFRFGDPESVKEKFDSLIEARDKVIKHLEPRISDSEKALLNYQNQARAYNFLMYYGRIEKGFEAQDPYFDFIEKINSSDSEAKSLPDMLLFKYEIELLREQDSIRDIPTFLGEIEKKTENLDLQNFLKAYYIKSVIEHPFYWRPHEQLFTTDKITEALEGEKTNPYSFLINRASNSFFSSMAGVEAFNFKAKTSDNSDFNLSDLKGKVILIDAWATWCGPCVKHRPNIIAIAAKYQNDPRVAVLMVSVDSELDRWKNFVSRTNPQGVGIEVNIPNGINDIFGDKYLVKAIPKYFLIDPKGIIISSDLPEPSLGMEKMIEFELEKM